VGARVTVVSGSTSAPRRIEHPPDGLTLHHAGTRL
jgi:hypothetical protein